MGSEGETHLPFPGAVLLGVVCGHARRTHTNTHVYCEWCPLLLGVLALLMRCEGGTEMEQMQGTGEEKSISMLFDKGGDRGEFIGGEKGEE